MRDTGIIFEMTKERLPNSMISEGGFKGDTTWSTLEEHRKEFPEHQVVITIKFRHDQNNEDSYNFSIIGDSGGSELINMLEDIRAYVISAHKMAEGI